MATRKRIVGRIPLETLWDEDGDFGSRIQALTSRDVVNKAKSLPIVVANLDHELQWIEQKDTAHFLKEVAGHISDSEENFLDDFPGGYFFWASEWSGRNGQNIIVLEMYH